jgi:hypothetical protein
MKLRLSANFDYNTPPRWPRLSARVSWYFWIERAKHTFNSAALEAHLPA